jgi:predicted helicase
MLELAPNDRVVKAYLQDLQRLKTQHVTNELALRGPFQNLLDKAARRRGWTLVPELSTYSGGRRVVPDGTVRDEYLLARGWWEAKDTSDRLAAEIQKKLKAGYPARNTIFEDTREAVLYQDGAEAGEFPLTEPVGIAALLNRFFSHRESDEREFARAMAEFKKRIPDLARSLHDHIAEAHRKNRPFKRAFEEFVTLCRLSLNPDLTGDQVDEMLIQHLLTERLMRKLFQNDEFTKRNVIAAQVESVIEALASGNFSKAEFLRKLDPYYNAIERAGANLDHFLEKQDFLNSVYEQFFQRFSPNVADTHGIVYTPREIVDYMCNSVEDALREEFGCTLASPEVVILDPCTGTGNFIVNLIRRMPGRALEDAYKHRLFANEVMLLPYYVASLNIEHAYYERKGMYEQFPGICFVDTLDMAEGRQGALFTAENTERVQHEKDAPVTVIIGNPPYNVGQKNENDNNRNRKYKVVDGRIRETYVADSQATLTMQLFDPYVRFFRWATDRLDGRDGILCFVSNNSFFGQLAFDGMRKHLSSEFERIDHIDLHGNVRRNPKISGTTHNVFGIQVGVGITLAVKKAGRQRRLRYHRLPEMARKAEKLDFLEKGQVPWQTLAPDSTHTWLVPEHGGEFGAYISIADAFEIHTRGVLTNNDSACYDFDRQKLEARARVMVEEFNGELDRWRRHGRLKQLEGWLRIDPKKLKWIRNTKRTLLRGQYLQVDPTKIRVSLYRPFTHKWHLFERAFNEDTYRWPKISGVAICLTDVGSEKPFMALVSTSLVDLHLVGAGSSCQCFPLSYLKPATVAQFREQYSDPSITPEDVFHYLYALLHHPGYRERYAANIKRELPRIPFAPDFRCFAGTGKELARLHVEYESLDPWPLEEIEQEGVPYSEYVTKMKFSPERQSLKVNECLTLARIPPEAFEYRLGSRSALEWVVDQYQVKGESDPNREDDPCYIVRLVGQVVRVSVETVRIVKSLPACRAAE